jgi:hypothetical protein
MEFISSPKVNEGHPNLLPIRITGTSVHDRALINTKFRSSSSAQSSPFQDPPLERKEILCYCHLWGEYMADTICAERGAERGMEPEHRCIVRNRAFLFRCATKSPPVMYNHSLELQYVFMWKGHQRKTFLSEGKR